ncbi:HNH endonuclease signature motif containing protein [Cumulibacter manganitolerans]|uniref:HNH endonuclease signature motif containing protein n=1 Tax=Cumulibacter manganitolerans TaxID=1884992 RepID=UPI001885F4E0|nr:HNH endonuclease signature motif containing protein [Cumulibacter manganitolerans]
MAVRSVGGEQSIWEPGAVVVGININELGQEVPTEAETAAFAARAEAAGVMTNHLAEHEAEVLAARIITGAAKVAVTTAAWIEMVGVFDARRGADHYNIESTSKWLAFSCSMSPGAAREHVRIARALRVMPLVAEAFGRGLLSFSKARECTRLAGLIDEATLVEVARNMTAAQLERAVRGFRAGRSQRLVAEEARRVTHRELPDGTIQISAWLPPEEAAIVLNALEIATVRYRSAAARQAGEEQSVLEEDVPAGTPDAEAPVPAFTLADALVDVARGFIDSGPADVSGEDRDVVVVHIDERDLRDAAAPDDDVPAGTRDADATDAVAAADADRFGGSTWAEPVGRLAATTAARIACTGVVQPVVTGADGEVLVLGRERRLATKAQKRALKARDRHCRFPGCTRATRLHAHHIVRWSLGGPTDVCNMLLLCQHHHVVVHAAGITITKRPSRRGYDFRRAGGQLITAQHPSQYSRAGLADPNLRHPDERELLAELTGDALRLQAAPSVVVPNQDEAWHSVSSIQPHWDLPAAMESVRRYTSVFDTDEHPYPRWAGARVGRTDMAELLEPAATSPITNEYAGY